MSTLKIDPNGILLLAVAAGAAWWLMTRKARAQTVNNGALLPAGSGATVYQAPASQQPDPLNPFLNLVGQKIGGWLGTNTAPTVTGPDLTAVSPGPGQWATDAYGNGIY